MTQQISDDDLEKLVLETIKNINIESAAHSKPVYSLAGILALKKMTALRLLARAMNIASRSKLRKVELIDAIVAEMQQPDTLRTCLNSLHEIEWDFFQQVAAEKYLQTDKVYIDSYHLAQNIGLVQSFYYKGELYFVVSDEIKAAYNKLVKTNFPEERNYRDLLNNYAIAAVSLYGVISQEDFVELFNSQNPRKTSIDEMFPLLLQNIIFEAGYCFWDEYIVDDDFEEDDFEAVAAVVELRKGKPRYTPAKEEFLKYSDWNYYETTPQLITLKDYLAELIYDEDEVEALLDEIHDMSAVGANMQEYYDLLDSAGIVFDNKKQTKYITQLIIDVQNNTRQWINYGHTPNELNSLDKNNLLPFPTGQTENSRKIGRNEPCPCGSGKKYKKCCGR